MTEASAIIIADSISPEGIRLITFQLRYWRAIHAEFMTHRVFSRNAGSSRARPSKAIIEQVRNDPWGPIHWGSNQPGMQAGTELEGEKLTYAQLAWFTAAGGAANMAEAMLREGAHKQIVNRILEPFTYIDVVVTATDWNNWYALRDHPDAQPEIQDLARKMFAAQQASTPKQLKYGEWHLPYIADVDRVDAIEWISRNEGISPSLVSEGQVRHLLIKASAARCARVSYKLFDGTNANFEKDLELYEQLLVSKPLHASPAEHQATPDRSHADQYNPTPRWENSHRHGNLRGWIQFRKTLPNEWVPG